MKNIEKLIMEVVTSTDKDHKLQKMPLLSENEFKNYIMPLGKMYWEGASLIIAEKGGGEINKHIPELIEWLQDMNWPGSQTILDVLAKADHESLIKGIKNSLLNAKKSNDEMWIAGIEMLMRKADISVDDFGDNQYAEILKLGEGIY